MWALVQHANREPFTFGGRVVLHPDRAELAFLVPTHDVVELRGSTAEEVAERLGVPTMLLKDHPDMAAVSWPLDRRRFR